MITVAIVEDQNIFREALVSYLGGQADISLRGDYADCSSAFIAFQKKVPEVIVLDLSFPGMSGLDFLFRLRNLMEQPKVLVLSGTIGKAQWEELSSMGIQGVLDKTSRLSILLSAIRTIHAGGVFFDSRVVGDMSKFNSYGENSGQALTRREKEVISLIARGLSAKEVAGELGTSHRTVEKHKDNACRKLDVKGVANLTRKAVELGLLT
ncbi:MAG: response regulator transcription factor [Opitutales bacterium]|nr:response regulator transcription factor [Opitutales bacterium]